MTNAGTNISILHYTACTLTSGIIRGVLFIPRPSQETLPIPPCEGGGRPTPALPVREGSEERNLLFNYALCIINYAL